MSKVDFQHIMKSLEEYGTEQNRKIYKRHGCGDNIFGVSFANLKSLKKEIKKDHELAEKLWATGNIDAQILATMVGDAKEMKRENIEAWLKDISYYALVDEYVGNIVSKSPLSKELMKAWVNSEDEWVGRAGWQLLAILAMKDKELPNDYYEDYLKRIEDKIHESKNRTKHTMNNALIAIGMRNDTLESKALEVAARIGKVEVDHGLTSCKTPDAAQYIKKAMERKREKDNK